MTDDHSKSPAPPDRKLPPAPIDGSTGNGTLTGNMINVHNMNIQESANGVLAIPFRTDANNWALLEISRDEENRNWNQEDLVLVNQVTNQLSLALENANLFQQTQQLATELRILNEMGRDLSVKLDTQNVAEAIYRHTSRLMETEYLSIGLINTETDTIEFPFTSHNQERLNLPSMPLENDLRTTVLQTRSPLQVSTEDTELIEKLRLKDYQLNSEIKYWLCVPLLIGEKPIGIIEILNTKAVASYNEHQVNLLLSIANQSAIALENARLYALSQQAIEEMRALDILKSQFLANMSHELRTPLNSIIGFSRVILKGIDGPITDQQEQDLNAIHGSGQHLLRLINDILDISKIDAGKMELAKEEVDMSELIQSILPSMGGLLMDKPISLVQEISQDLPRIQADPIRIRQVLINLLSNAAKFTEKGTITLSASVEKDSKDKNELKIMVTDTGIGISPSDQDKLFEPFAQVDSSASRKTGGTGLGLSISRRLIELHGGKIGLISKVGEGSSFFFTLPI